MATQFSFGAINLPAGSNDLPVQTSPVSFSTMKLTLVFNSFPSTATFGYSQFVSRDGGTTWEPYGAAQIGPGLTDKNGNPTLTWPFEASVILPDGQPFVPVGAKVRVHIDNPQNVDIASGTLVLT